MIKIFIGYDVRDAQAYEVLVKSLYATTKEPLEIIPILDHKLREQSLFWRSYRVDDKGQYWDDRDGKPFSTLFSFTRFCVPMMNGFKDEKVIYMDADMLVRCDITELMDYASNSAAVSVVQHEHVPVEDHKMGSLLQTMYARKNWSSLMVMNTAKCRALDAYTVNNNPGAYLHGLRWVEDDQIGALPEAWNWLEGWSSPTITPANIHFTRGTPDMPGCENVAYKQLWWNYVEDHHAAA